MLLILNDIAASEIVLILVFVLIFFGSKSIPGLAKTLAINTLSKAVNNRLKIGFTVMITKRV